MKKDVQLSSGETIALDMMQEDFYQLFDEVPTEEYVEDFEFWDFEHVFENSAGEQHFFSEAAKIKSIPEYKYLINYLLAHFDLTLEVEEKEKLWDYLGTGKWKVKLKNIEAEIEAFKRTLFTLALKLQNSYQENGFQGSGNWTTYFKALIDQTNEKRFNELALGIGMDYDIYRSFRKKVLKQTEINFYSRQHILLYLVLKYAKTCGQDRYFDAYEKLEQLYPYEEQKVEKQWESTKAIGGWMLEHLEENEELKQSYRETLFVKADPQIHNLLIMVESLTRKEKSRSGEVMFKKLWDQFEQKLLNSREADFIVEKYSEDKEGVFLDKVVTLGKQNIYRWLYGEKVNTNAVNRIIDIKDSEMTLIGEEEDQHFLDSKVFLETRIRDNTFSAFPLDEERQRNLLLTVVFLNYAFEVDFLADCYSDRIDDFDIEVFEVLQSCGFQSVHSGNGYDAYLKLLLSCDMPLQLFRYVWRKKTGSEE